MPPRTARFANRRVVGWSLVIYGFATLLQSVVASYFVDGLMVDAGAIVVLWLGYYVIAGGRRATRWSLALMVYYAAISAYLLYVASASPEKLRIGMRSATAEQVDVAIAFLAVDLVWATANGVMLAALLRSSSNNGS